MCILVKFDVSTVVCLETPGHQETQKKPDENSSEKSVLECNMKLSQ